MELKLKIKTSTANAVSLGVQILVRSRIVIPVYILQPSEAINITERGFQAQGEKLLWRQAHRRPLTGLGPAAPVLASFLAEPCVFARDVHA